MPEGSGLQAGREFRNLQFGVDALGGAIRLERLEGLVTPGRLAERLRGDPWDVVHFIGHGRTDPRGRVHIRLVPPPELASRHFNDWVLAFMSGQRGSDGLPGAQEPR